MELQLLSNKILDIQRCILVPQIKKSTSSTFVLPQNGFIFVTLKDMLECWALRLGGCFFLRCFADLESVSHRRLFVQDLSDAILSNAEDKCHHPSATGEPYRKTNSVRVSSCQLRWLTLDRFENLKIIVLLMSKHSTSAAESLWSLQSFKSLC